MSTRVVPEDGGAIVIDIPLTFRHKYGRKEIVPPVGIEDQAMPRSATPSPLALAVARAFRWQEMIETGQAKSNCDLARKLKLDQSYVARTIRMASLAPDVIEATATSFFDDYEVRFVRRVQAADFAREVERVAHPR